MTSSEIWLKLNYLIDQYKTKNGIWWPKLKLDNEFNLLFDNNFPLLNDIIIQFKAYICVNKLSYEEYKCPCCDKPKRFNKNKNLLFTYCSDECKKLEVGKNISFSLKEKYKDEDIKQQSIMKRQNTNIEKYGYSCQFIGQSEKIKNTNIEKYGIDNFFKQDMKKYQLKNGILPQQEHLLNLDNFEINYMKENFFIDDKFDMLSASNYYNCSYDILRKFLKDNNVVYKKHSQSYAELFLLNYLDQFNPVANNRDFGKEIDILLHDYKFGIEYNGLMFHSYGKNKHKMFDNHNNIDSKKHLHKTNLLEEKEYQLFHIFENEFTDIIKRNIWLSMINNKVHISEKIFARKCIIKELDSTKSSDFLKYNHIQGSINSSINLGLYYNDKLVCLMTLGKSRLNKSYEYEIYRFCNLLNTNVIGGASKLLKYFERNYNPKSIISYANRRWSRGNLYYKLGFDLLNISDPNFFYFKQVNSDYKLYSRLKFQKFKLESELEIYDSNLSARENMINNNYRIIYDSGNLAFGKQY